MADLLNTEACTLPTAERPLRRAEFDVLFAESVCSLERDGDTLRLRLTGRRGRRDRVEDLARREAVCCSFFTFRIEGSDANRTLDISVPSGRRDILDALTARARELSR